MDADLIEKVQRRYTKYIPALIGLTYPERLKRLQLQTLEERRLIADLCQVYKIYNGLDTLIFEEFFTKNDQNTRGHTFKLCKERSNYSTRANYFSVRIIDSWNALPLEVVEARSLDSFKQKLKNINLYDLNNGNWRIGSATYLL